MKQIQLVTFALAATILALPLLAVDQPNALSEKEQAAGWQSLFNGRKKSSGAGEPCDFRESREALKIFRKAY